MKTKLEQAAEKRKFWKSIAIAVAFFSVAVCGKLAFGATRPAPSQVYIDFIEVSPSNTNRNLPCDPGTRLVIANQTVAIECDENFGGTFSVSLKPGAYRARLVNTTDGDYPFMVRVPRGGQPVSVLITNTFGFFAIGMRSEPVITTAQLEGRQ